MSNVCMKKPKTTNPSPEILSALTKKVAEDVILVQPLDDIILMVCEQTGWNWDKAKNFVLTIEEQNLQRKLRRTKIFLLMSGITIVLGGTAIFFYMGYLGFVLLRGSMIRNDDLLSTYFFFDFWIYSAPFFIGGMFFGLGIIAGGAYGIGKALGRVDIW